MVVEGLDIGEHAHGVRFVAHLQHVVHLDQTETVGLGSDTGGQPGEMSQINSVLRQIEVCQI